MVTENQDVTVGWPDGAGRGRQQASVVCGSGEHFVGYWGPAPPGSASVCVNIPHHEGCIHLLSKQVTSCLTEYTGAICLRQLHKAK